MHGIYQHEQIRQEWFRHFSRHELMKKYIVSLGTLIYVEKRNLLGKRYYQPVKGHSLRSNCISDLCFFVVGLKRNGCQSSFDY